MTIQQKFVVLAIGSLFVVAGCGGSDSENLTSPIPGKIIIRITPDSLNAPWALAGPDGYSLVGAGSADLEELESGEYSLSWGLVTGWLSPESQTFDFDQSSGKDISGVFLDSVEVLDSPTAVINNLKLSYERMLVNEPSKMFHSAFRAYVEQAALDEWSGGGNPIENGYFSAAQILEIHANLLGGHEGVGPGGETIPAVASIEFTDFVSPSNWEAVSPNTPYFGAIPGAVVANGYFAGFFNNPNNHRYQSGHGGPLFFAEEGGHWKLLGWGGPLAGSQALPLKATENIRYSSLLAIFR